MQRQRIVYDATGITDSGTESSSLDGAPFDDAELFVNSVNDDVSAQLASAGPIGVAAAAAIASGKKRHRAHSFEINPSIRRRQQTRLLRKLRATIDEYSTRVGQQAVLLCCTPGKPQHVQSFRVFGSQPLENVLRDQKGSIMNELDQALALQTPPKSITATRMFELPPLVVDGIPTPIDKMTQAQLRAFIPEMLKYSTGRSKPGWGKVECYPPWWPDDVPWANIRSDVRTDEQKQRVPWTVALQMIVRNCYEYHGRQDLLPHFVDQHDLQAQFAAGQFAPTILQTITNPDGTLSLIQIDAGDALNDTGLQFVTFPDGSHAQVIHTNLMSNDASDAVQLLAQVAANQNSDGCSDGSTLCNIDINNDSNQELAAVTAATINQDGQLVLNGEAMSSMGLVNISASLYNRMIEQLTQANRHESGESQMVISDERDLYPLLHAKDEDVTLTSHAQVHDIT